METNVLYTDVLDEVLWSKSNRINKHQSRFIITHTAIKEKIIINMKKLNIYLVFSDDICE